MRSTALLGRASPSRNAAFSHFSSRDGVHGILVPLAASRMADSPKNMITT